MFHSVGPTQSDWVFSYLTDSLGCFEGTLAGLKQAGFRTVTLEALYRHMSGSERLSGHCVALTFDDGYLDNWVYAVPLLRKYGMQATVYVSPEFVEPGDVVRPTRDCSAIIRGDEPAEVTPGFMNWAELRAAQAEGVLDVQSHAMTHTWYFTGPKCVDIHRPRKPDPYPWLAWNARPDRKPYYMSEDQQGFVPWGHPVFEFEKSLVARRFSPDPAAVAEIAAWVAAQGGATFFDETDWRATLEARFDILSGVGTVPGEYESDEGYRERVLGELKTSRELIETHLDKPVRYLAWPGGGVNDDVCALAREAGYRSWTLSSWKQSEKRNVPGADASSIKRVSGSGTMLWRNRRLGAEDWRWVILRTLSHQGDAWSRLRIRARKITGYIAAIVRDRLHGSPRSTMKPS
jgi:peptidoglycan/xylan/chitin deacetylase (PgdA/CDA1 family)